MVPFWNLLVYSFIISRKASAPHRTCAKKAANDAAQAKSNSIIAKRPAKRKQGMRRVNNSMHRKSRRLLRSIVILSIENPSNHTDNAKKCGAQKIADTLRTRMLGKSPVCQNSGVGKKGEMLENCQQRQQQSKKQISNRRQKNSFRPMLFARLPTRTHEHQPEKIVYLGN